MTPWRLRHGSRIGQSDGSGPRAIEALGPIGSRVLHDTVRVWAVVVEPGAKQSWHRHLLPYLIVPQTGGDIEIESVDGVIRRPKETVGEVMWREAGDVAIAAGSNDTGASAASGAAFWR